MLTRIAPTPSGYLHLGNAVHAALVSTLAERFGADIALRIDDADPARTRVEYVENIFEVLAWLGIDWSLGPRTAGEASQRWSHQRSAIDWRAEISHARAAGLPAYVCRCSRKQIAGLAIGGCPGGCRDRDWDLVEGESALRVHVPRGTTVSVGDGVIDLATEMGDFILWRREGVPAYQLESVLADRDLGTDLLIRGADLRGSTAAQFYIARYFGADTLTEAVVIHHRLLRDVHGVKLSKSAGHGAQPLVQDEATSTLIWRSAKELADEVKY